MADNVTAAAATGGATFATDEDTVNSRHFPGSKIMLGVENAFTGYWDGSVSVGSALPAGTNNIGDVDVLTLPALPAGTNNIGDVDIASLPNEGQQTMANSISVAVASDQSAIPSSQSGTWTVGISAGTNNIGDVDVLTVPAPLSTTGGGTEAAALRVTIANDSTGLISIDDGGNVITVDGSVSITGPVDTELTTADVDTGAGTDTRAVVGLVGTASGGGQLIPGSATDGLLVNLGANNDVTVTGSVTVLASTNNIGDVDVLTVPAPLSTTGGGTEATALRVTIATDSTGVISIDDGGNIITVDGTVAATQSGTWTVEPGNTPNTVAWLVTARPSTSGGLSPHVTISAASTNATVVKGTPGQMYAVQMFNTSASPRFVKLYNKATAPTVGTDTPIKTLTVPGNTAGAGLVLNWNDGIEFTAGIGFAITAGVAHSDTSAVGADEVVVNIDFK